MGKDIKQLLLDKIEVAEMLNKSGATVFIDELKQILKYIEDLEKEVK